MLAEVYDEQRVSREKEIGELEKRTIEIVRRAIPVRADNFRCIGERDKKDSDVGRVQER